MPETPEQRARREIDAKLSASGWIVFNRDELDITAGRGIAVREFPMKTGFGFGGGQGGRNAYRRGGPVGKIRSWFAR